MIIVLLLLLLLAIPVSAQEAEKAISIDMLPEGYLVDVPADSIIAGYLCPMHPKVTAEKEGTTCYICGMGLVDGSIKMPHGSHDPHYGGIFFMARDSWHHIEGAMPAPGVFRFHMYDNYSIPMTTMFASGRLIFREFRDENGDQVRPPIETPLVESPDGVSFIVTDRRLQLERDFHILIRFKPEQAEEDRFDFAFYDYSKTEEEAAGQARFEPEKDLTSSLVIPETRTEILQAIRSRMDKLSALINRSKLNEFFLPALEIKDLALALTDNPGELDEEQLDRLKIAVKSIIKSAWWLDTYGDYGDKPESEASFRVMSESVDRIEALYQ